MWGIAFFLFFLRFLIFDDGLCWGVVENECAFHGIGLVGMKRVLLAERAPTNISVIAVQRSTKLVKANLVVSRGAPLSRR